MESAGYWVGIYSSESFFNSEMNDGELTRYSHWVARWGKSKPAPNSGAETQMWQFGGGTNLIRNITDEAVQKYIKEQAEESRKEDSRSTAL